MKQAKSLNDIKNDPRVADSGIQGECEAQYYFKLKLGFQVENDERHFASAETVKELCWLFNNCVTVWDKDPDLNGANLAKE